ncbi:MAG: DsbE family thiol:disulfide interchange protein [Tatlockia sp.]|jgi:cytochrome c biogenesis protein CcmG/thiol:disulfide interchange protein DsbE
MKKQYWRLIPIALFVGLLFFFWRGLSLEPHKLPSVLLNQPLPAFTLPALNQEGFLTPERMKGHIALLNVWASWCAACVEEEVFLMQLAREGVPIFGLNYKDTTKDASLWLSEWGNPYQIIGQDKKGLVAIDLGVYGAPETFLIDKKGIIRYRHVGILDEKAWKTQFLPRMAQLQGEA